MKENLKVGTTINASISQTSGNGIEKYCFNNLENNCSAFGWLYQWAEAVAYTNCATNSSSPSPAFSGNVQGLCQTGWHIPPTAEFEACISEVDGDSNATTLKANSVYGTNTSGFSALLGVFFRCIPERVQYVLEYYGVRSRK